jgi:hypothetical protein
LIKNTFTIALELLIISMLFMISILYLWKIDFFKIEVIS